VTLRSGFRPTNRAEVLGVNLIRVWETERFASRGSFAVRLRGSSSGSVTRRRYRVRESALSAGFSASVAES
jgi:hypothetical protein